MRARETNGSILIAVTARKSEMDLDAAQWKTFRKNADLGRVTKHALWRGVNGKYHLDREAKRVSDDLIGMVENANVTSNQMVRFHVTVRGIVSVPIWWFTSNEYECRVHEVWGPLFTKQVGKGVKSYFDGRFPADVSRDYGITLERHRPERILSTCYSCYFRV